MFTRSARIVCFVALLLPFPAIHAAPRVVVSVTPIHSLVSGVMQGVGAPELLIQGGASPHTYTLRPSDAKALQDAQVVFWVGEGLEAFLQKPLAALAGRATVVKLMDSTDLRLLPARVGGTWERHEEDEHGHEAHDEASLDAHFWLDPENAKRTVEIIRTTLSKIDPEHSAAYTRNAQGLAQRLDALDAELRTALQPVQRIPFIVFHDAYQYLETRYGLDAIGSITVSAEQRPSARRVAEIRAKIKAANVRCVFHEPQFPTTLIATIVEGANVRTGTLDPLGAQLTPGPEAYFELMRNAAGALQRCLAP